MSLPIASAITSIFPRWAMAYRIAADIIRGMSMIKHCMACLLQNLGMRSVLLIMAVPDSANSRHLEMQLPGPELPHPAPQLHTQRTLPGSP